MNDCLFSRRRLRRLSYFMVDSHLFRVLRYGELDMGGYRGVTLQYKPRMIGWAYCILFYYTASFDKWLVKKSEVSRSSCLPSASVSSVYLVLYVEKILLHPFLYLLVCWTCGIGPWPGRLSSFSANSLFHCWLSHLTCKIVSEMTIVCRVGR